MQHLLTLFMAVAGVNPAPGMGAAPVYGELFVPGELPEDEAPADGERVLALCDGVLRSVRARVTPLRGEQVKVSVPCRATMMVRGVPTLSPGRVRWAAVKTGPMARTSPFGPERVSLRLGDRAWRIHRIRLGSTGYRLELRGAHEPVVLYEAQSTDLAKWELLWAGDLDRDGKLDLLIDASDALNQSELRLFLSRNAEEAVDEAAWLRTRR